MIKTRVSQNFVWKTTNLSQSRNKHDARDECHTSGQSREQSENHQNIADVHVADVNELVGNYVVTVMCRSWHGHRVAVKIKNSRDNREQGNELKVKQHQKLDLNRKVHYLQCQQLTWWLLLSGCSCTGYSSPKASDTMAFSAI